MPASQPPHSEPACHARVAARLGLLLLSLSWMLSSFPVAWAGSPQAAGGGSATASPEDLAKTIRCNPGPWGDLDYHYLHLEMPGWIMRNLNRHSTVTQWHFPGGTEAGVRALLVKAGLPAALQSYLLDPAHKKAQGNVLTLFPPVPDLVAMTPAQRSVIYRELAMSELNINHQKPVYILNGDPDSWFAGSGLPPGLIQMIKKMTYELGDVLCFSDLAAVLATAKSQDEALGIFRAVNRTTTLVLRLNLKPSMDLEQVVRYWTANQRNRDVEQVLRSAAKTTGLEQLDVIHLLPFLPRRYLYSYFSGELSVATSSLPNCHWTSLNFFNSTPLDYHRDPRLATLHLNEDYERVPAPFSFGDVLVLVARDGTPRHSCVYIADDVVYTKNGSSVAIPWVLMKLHDVVRLYSQEEPVTIQGRRLKATVRNEAP